MEEKFEDTKWVIRSCKSKKDRQCNDKQNKEERTNILYKKTLHRKVKGRVTRTTVQTGVNPYIPETKMG
jgi:hypothetical protein